MSVTINLIPKADKFFNSGVNIEGKFCSSHFSNLLLLISRKLEKLSDFFAFCHKLIIQYLAQLL